MKEYEIIEFVNQKGWRTWLSVNYTKTEGVWLRLYKKASNLPSVSYTEALDDALCFGWIDGQKKKYDDVSYIQKFTPRRVRSVWSKRNTEHIERLTTAKLMTPLGLVEVEKAKMDGRWENAYESQRNMVVPEDFLLAVQADKKAFLYYKTLNKSDLYSIVSQLNTAKKVETRERRFKCLFEKLRNNESFR